MKCAWIKRLVSESGAGWKHLVLRQLPCKDKYLSEYNFHSTDVKNIFNKVKSIFWLEVIYSWIEYNYQIPETKGEVVAEVL